MLESKTKVFELRHTECELTNLIARDGIVCRLVLALGARFKVQVYQIMAASTKLQDLFAYVPWAFPLPSPPLSPTPLTPPPTHPYRNANYSTSAAIPSTPHPAAAETSYPH